MSKLRDVTYGRPLIPIIIIFVTSFQGLSFSAGLSLCLRVFLKFFNENCVFQSDKMRLSFRDYKSPVGGGLTLEKRNYVFGWPGKFLS